MDIRNMLPSLKLTASSPLKIDAWKMKAFLLGPETLLRGELAECDSFFAKWLFRIRESP